MSSANNEGHEVWSQPPAPSNSRSLDVDTRRQLRNAVGKKLPSMFMFLFLAIYIRFFHVFFFNVSERMDVFIIRESTRSDRPTDQPTARRHDLWGMTLYIPHRARRPSPKAANKCRATGRSTVAIEGTERRWSAERRRERTVVLISIRTSTEHLARRTATTDTAVSLVYAYSRSSSSSSSCIGLTLC